jgi:hypothetical protein
MLAVSNTSPISNLASIGLLNLLKLQFGALWIPGAVDTELQAHPDPAAPSTLVTARPACAARFFIAPSLEARVLSSASE